MNAQSHPVIVFPVVLDFPFSVVGVTGLITGSFGGTRVTFLTIFTPSRLVLLPDTSSASGSSLDDLASTAVGNVVKDPVVGETFGVAEDDGLLSGSVGALSEILASADEPELCWSRSGIGVTEGSSLGSSTIGVGGRKSLHGVARNKRKYFHFYYMSHDQIF